ncbi:MAG: mucoidy inhibitor MuiA family protein [Lachnospiraceae bacterium]|nr:mucoidy inhibitor MuiA family protein [Lachnospiraceae bacterium]
MIINTEAKEVKVYRRSATIIRIGKVNLVEGRNTIYIAGMSETSQKDSFVVKFPGKVRASNIQIVGIDALDDDLKQSQIIAKKLSELHFNIETCESMMNLWKSNGNFSTRSDVSIEAQKQYMDELPGKISEFRKQFNELNEEKEKLGKELEKVSKEEERPIIMADLICEEAGEYDFILQYQDNSGGWSPKYEVRYSDDDKPLEVSMKAKITQNSKEDWKKVKVTLYTGNPSISHDVPQVPVYKLSIYEPPKLVERRAAMDTMMGASAMMGAAAAGAAPNAMMGFAGMGMMQAMATPMASVSEEETMTAFELPDLRDILSDTDGNIANLQSFDVDAEYSILCVPMVTEKAYMTARIKSADWPFQSANASIYLKDMFAGEVYVDPDSDTEEFTLSLGQDERINVIRKEIMKKTQDVFLKNQKKKNCEYEIKIANKSSETVKVLIKDQIPVSTDKSIDVNISEISSGKVSEESGEVSWNINLDPKGSSELKIAYAITWPKDKKLKEEKTSGSVGSKICPLCGARASGMFCPECGGKL